MKDWLVHIIECVARGWSPEGCHVAQALHDLNERVENQEKRIAALEKKCKVKDPGTLNVGPGIP